MRIPAEKYRAHLAAKNGRKGKNKYGATKVSKGSETFDSKREFERWSDLVMLEKAGHISDLKRQVAFVLHGAGNVPLVGDNNHQLKYYADATYTDDSGEFIIEDVKSKGSKATRTGVYQLKKAIMRGMGLTITEV